MKYVWIVVGLLLAFVLWRYTSVARGARKRDRTILRLLEPIEVKLHLGERVDPEEIARIAAAPHVRGHLFHLLEHFGVGELFPRQLSDTPSQAIAQLAYWLMHPNEFGEPAEEFEVEEHVQRSVQGALADFYVIRFRMGEGHWAGRDWLLGVAGPFFAAEPPFGGVAGAFSRAGDKAGATDPRELVDWFVRLSLGRADDGS